GRERAQRRVPVPLLARAPRRLDRGERVLGLVPLLLVPARPRGKLAPARVVGAGAREVERLLGALERVEGRAEVPLAPVDVGGGEPRLGERRALPDRLLVERERADVAARTAHRRLGFEEFLLARLPARARVVERPDRLRAVLRGDGAVLLREAHRALEERDG